MFRKRLITRCSGVQPFRRVIGNGICSLHDMGENQIHKLQDCIGTAEIFIQLDASHAWLVGLLAFPFRKPHALQKVFRIRQPELIDGLLDIAHQKYIISILQRSVCIFSAAMRKQLENHVLLIVCILIFVNHNDLIFLREGFCQWALCENAVLHL